MKKMVGFWVFYFTLCAASFSQADTAYIYNPNTSFGVLDLRLSKSSTNYYYLKEDQTFAFRESAPGVKTNAFRDMTAWDSNPYAQGNLREKNGAADYFVMNYRLLKPNNYNTSYAEGYPLIVMMHGAGEMANCWKTRCYHADINYNPAVNSPAAPTTLDHPLLNNDHQLIHGGQDHITARNLAGSRLPNDPSMPQGAFPGFVLFPQNLNGWNPASVSDVIRIVRLMVRKYNIDQNRIYIHGLSNGGFGVYEAIKRAPWMFAAALPMSAISDGGVNDHKMAPKIANIPLWIFQGGLDENPYPHKTEAYIKLFRDAGAIVRYTYYPTIGHSTWNSAFKEPDFFSWMLSKNKSSIHVFAGNAAICKSGTSGLKLEIAEGFKAYQWEKNGQVIAGATSASYMATSAGVYRARFSRISSTPTEAQWNRWSEPVSVKEQPQPNASINQIGTVLLKDLNGNNEAKLESKQEFAHYYWYKNGTLIDQPGTQDDTVKLMVIKPEMGNGTYTLVTSNFDDCKSAPSQAKHVFFSDQAPLNLPAPTNFRGYGEAGAVNIVLTWNDNSVNEIGFEVWRRKKSEESLTPWQMVTLTSANASLYKDTGLEPLTTYQYKIRAVSNSGRSNYNPASATEFLEIKTAVDKQAPKAPQNLVIKHTAIKKIIIAWSPAEDNTGIQEYIIYYGKDSLAVGPNDTTYVFNNLELNKIFEFRVKAIDLGGNHSPKSNNVIGSTFVSGLYFEHSTGAWPELDSINWNIAELTGFVNNFTLSKKTQEDYFNFRFDGYLFVTTAGVYQFRTTSNDGSRFKLDGKTIVDNDGIHDLSTVTSVSQNIAKGPIRILVEFFDYNQKDSLRVEYKGPDSNNTWMTIPSSVLKSALITSIEPGVTLDNPLNVSVYPNPSSQHDINVQVESVSNAPVRVRLMDPVGRAVFDNAFEIAQIREGTRVSPAERLSGGIYIIIVNQNGNVVKRKVMIKE